MCEKDYNLLRPFDLEAAKSGEAICYSGGAHANYIAGPDQDGTVIVTWNDDLLRMTKDNHLRMAPLCWVEGRPVYKWDVLWNKYRRDKVIAGSIDNEVFLCEPGERTGDCIDNLTWTPPKVKREGWINIYETYQSNDKTFTCSSFVYPTRKGADDVSTGRKACIHIEWEE